jgi:hypothetical protein
MESETKQLACHPRRDFRIARGRMAAAIRRLVVQSKMKITPKARAADRKIGSPFESQSRYKPSSVTVI